MRAKFVDGRWRPLILVNLTIGANATLVWMLVDTGADRSMVSPDLATALAGVDFDHLGGPGPMILGAGDDPNGGGTPSREVDATISYLGKDVPTKLWVARTPYPVVGRDDFMKHFECSFYWDRTPPEFTVTRTPEPRPPKAPNPTIRPKKRR